MPSARIVFIIDYGKKPKKKDSKQKHSEHISQKQAVVIIMTEWLFSLIHRLLDV